MDELDIQYRQPCFFSCLFSFVFFMIMIVENPEGSRAEPWKKWQQTNRVESEKKKVKFFDSSLYFFVSSFVLFFF